MTAATNGEPAGGNPGRKPQPGGKSGQKEDNMKIEVTAEGKYRISNAKVYVLQPAGNAREIEPHAADNYEKECDGVKWTERTATVKVWVHDTPEAARIESERAEADALAICAAHNAGVRARYAAAQRVNEEIESARIVPQLLADYRAGLLLHRNARGQVEKYEI
ncbi:MAG: hypothetical protein ACOYOU_15130 [Kiritimatiellia bacterium]